MSKKNNRARGKQYAQFLMDEEKREEKERTEKLERKGLNRVKNQVMDEINNLDLNTEKEDRMNLESEESIKKQKKKSKIVKK